MAIRGESSAISDSSMPRHRTGERDNHVVSGRDDLVPPYLFAEWKYDQMVNRPGAFVVTARGTVSV